MIIGIDVSSVPYGTGVSNYTLNLVRNLAKIDKINQYKLFFSSYGLKLPKEIKELEKYKNFKIYSYRYPLDLLEKIWHTFRLFPIENFIGKCDIFHTSDWTQPPTCKAKTITTVHDLVPFLHPEWSDPKIIKVHHRKLKLAIKYCRQFICVSHKTKEDLISVFPKINSQKISVIYEAAEDKFSKFSENRKNIIEKQYDLKKYFLTQGTREPRKNLKRIIEAFILYKQKNPTSLYELAISGKYGWGSDILKYKRPDIKILGYIPEKDLVSLHAATTCLIYPSLYEGFGLPVIKSLKVNVPVITSKDSAMSEIASTASILVNPESVEEIASAMELITKNSSLRFRLIQNAKKISPKFSWLNTARETLKVYKSL